MFPGDKEKPLPKLHELLAVEGNLANQSNKCRGELLGTFDKKRHHFGEKRVTFTANSEGASAVTEEQSDIQTTVAKEIEWLAGIMAKAVDASHQIDMANTQARADVITEEGQTVLRAVPATSLLQLEKSLKDVHDLLNAVPTLDPAKGFQPDQDRGKHIFKARDVHKNRTKKIQRPLELSPATEKHPAQVQLITEDVVVGTILEQEWSSLITPALKSELLDRCDILLRAVKRARARANEIELDVAGNKIGKTLLDFVFQPLNA
jgi:hypothetical protein